MLEVLVALVIASTGVLGIIGMQARTQQASIEAFQRNQAIAILGDMGARISGNKPAARCYAVSTDMVAGQPYLGIGASVPAPCTDWGTDATRQRADADLAAWHDLLRGAGETVAGETVPAMIGARGCIAYDGATDSYVIAVSWQGMFRGSAAGPADTDATCASALYGDASLRRGVSVRLAFSALN